jgi:hypothetical protein
MTTIVIAVAIIIVQYNAVKWAEDSLSTRTEDDNATTPAATGALMGTETGIGLATTGTATGAAVTRTATGATVGTFTGAATGATVGATTGTATGATVGAATVDETGVNVTFSLSLVTESVKVPSMPIASLLGP